MSKCSMVMSVALCSIYEQWALFYVELKWITVPWQFSRNSKWGYHECGKKKGEGAGRAGRIQASLALGAFSALPRGGGRGTRAASGLPGRGARMSHLPGEGPPRTEGRGGAEPRPLISAASASGRPARLGVCRRFLSPGSRRWSECTFREWWN